MKQRKKVIVILLLLVLFIALFIGLKGPALCLAGGGKWEQSRELTPYPMFICMHSYIDAGKECHSSSECQGSCQADRLNASVGKCSANDHLSCFWRIEDSQEGKPGYCF